MPSAALSDWKSHRATRLDRLLAAHRTVRVANSGRRWITEELNHSLILRLAAEFQGFARQLHDETSEVLVAALAPDDPAARQPCASRTAPTVDSTGATPAPTHWAPTSTCSVWNCG